MYRYKMCISKYMPLIPWELSLLEIVQSLVYAIQYVFEKIYVCRLTPGVQMDGAQPGKKRI